MDLEGADVEAERRVHEAAELPDAGGLGDELQRDRDVVREREGIRDEADASPKAERVCVDSAEAVATT